MNTNKSLGRLTSPAMYISMVTMLIVPMTWLPLKDRFWLSPQGCAYSIGPVDLVQKPVVNPGNPWQVATDRHIARLGFQLREDPVLNFLERSGGYHISELSLDVDGRTKYIDMPRFYQHDS